jgi:hypothetical protein
MSKHCLLKDGHEKRKFQRQWSINQITGNSAVTAATPSRSLPLHDQPLSKGWRNEIRSTETALLVDLKTKP